MVASIKPHRDELGLGDGLMLIDGRWAAAADGASWSHTHPATGEQVASSPVAGPAEVDLAVRGTPGVRRRPVAAVPRERALPDAAQDRGSGPRARR
jgi:hypothetical protein